MRYLHKSLFLVNLLLFLIFTVGFAYGAPASKLLDKHWEKYDGNSKIAVEHVMWDNFLASYAREGGDGINRVLYPEVKPEDLALLNDYIVMLENTDVTVLNRDEQMVFWINLYNALTVKVVLDAYPVDSIRDISGGFLSFGPWDKEYVKVMGRDLSLNNIEHNILRPIWKDNRIHYAVNCASLGCPNLALRAYYSKTLEKMLDEAAYSYVNHSRGVKFDKESLIVSSIYNWYEVDFGGNKSGVIEHFRRYARGELKEKLKNNVVIVEYDYDWSLNRF